MIKSYQQFRRLRSVLGVLIPVLWISTLIVLGARSGVLPPVAAVLLFVCILSGFYSIQVGCSADFYMYDTHFAIENVMKFWANNIEINYRDLKKVRLRNGSKVASLYLFLHDDRRIKVGVLGLKTEQMEDLVTFFEERGVATEIYDITPGIYGLIVGDKLRDKAKR